MSYATKHRKGTRGGGAGVCRNADLPVWPRRPRRLKPCTVPARSRASRQRMAVRLLLLHVDTAFAEWWRARKCRLGRGDRCLTVAALTGAYASYIVGTRNSVGLLE